MHIEGKGINLERTFRCGQAFRWKEQDGAWFGVSGGRALRIGEKSGQLELSCGPEELPFWQHYLGLDRDYSILDDLLRQDERTSPCLEYSEGIRVLRQDPYEALITFIVSQNNNVGRIAGIVERLCENYGESRVHAGAEYRAFPQAGALAKATVEELVKLGAGYRAQYILDAARTAQDYDFLSLKKLPFEQARKELCTLRGVGPKVAECVMLFSLDFDMAFPVDVWVGRVVEFLYPGEDKGFAAHKAAERFGEWAGAAQQYLFHYARAVSLGKKRS